MASIEQEKKKYRKLLKQNQKPVYDDEHQNLIRMDRLRRQVTELQLKKKIQTPKLTDVYEQTEVKKSIK